MCWSSYLELSINQLSGSIPSSIGALTGLTYVRLIGLTIMPGCAEEIHQWVFSPESRISDHAMASIFCRFDPNGHMNWQLKSYRLEREPAERHSTIYDQRLNRARVRRKAGRWVRELLILLSGSARLEYKTADCSVVMTAARVTVCMCARCPVCVINEFVCLAWVFVRVCLCVCVSASL